MDVEIHVDAQSSWSARLHTFYGRVLSIFQSVSCLLTLCFYHIVVPATRLINCRISYWRGCYRLKGYSDRTILKDSQLWNNGTFYTEFQPLQKPYRHLEIITFRDFQSSASLIRRIVVFLLAVWKFRSRCSILTQIETRSPSKIVKN